MALHTKIKLLAGSALLVAPLLVGTASAQNNTNNRSVRPVQAQTDTGTDEGAQRAATTQKETLEERLARRKEALKIKLTNAETTRLKAKCKGAQTVVKKLAENAEKVEANRLKTYSAINDNLSNLITRLEAQEIDVTALKALQTEYAAKLETFKADIAAYKIALEDMANITDCSADPTAFKASLQEARDLRVELVKQAVDIKQHLTTSTKETLQDIRKQLDEAKNEGVTTTEPETETEIDAGNASAENQVTEAE